MLLKILDASWIVAFLSGYIVIYIVYFCLWSQMSFDNSTTSTAEDTSKLYNKNQHVSTRITSQVLACQAFSWTTVIPGHVNSVIRVLLSWINASPWTIVSLYVLGRALRICYDNPYTVNFRVFFRTSWWLAISNSISRLRNLSREFCGEITGRLVLLLFSKSLYI